MVQPLRTSKAAPSLQPANRRGRPTADQALAIDMAIRAAALDLFIEVGFEAASMDAIAARAPVSKGTLYARYESKEQLFRAVMTGQLERFSTQAGANDHLLPDTIEPRLRHHARIMIEVFNWSQFQVFSRLMESAVRILPELDRAWHEIATGGYLRFLSDDIAKAADTQGLSPEDCKFLAHLFLYSISGWLRVEAALRTVPDEEVIAFADRVIDTIMLSIRQRRGA